MPCYVMTRRHGAQFRGSRDIETYVRSAHMCNALCSCCVWWLGHITTRQQQLAALIRANCRLKKAKAAADTHLAVDVQVALLLPRLRVTTAAVSFTGSYAAVLCAQLCQRSEPCEVAQPHQRQFWAKQDVQRRQPCNTMRPSTLELCRAGGGVSRVACMHVPVLLHSLHWNACTSSMLITQPAKEHTCPA
jgi:hypothetical protein